MSDCNTDSDLEYLRECLMRAPFYPYEWHGEDRNIGAFRSREDLVAWYCQPPGVEDQPYRDRAFYTRELAMLSRTIRPATVVEFGTCQGIGTCLLSWLNPSARLVTVDINTVTFMPGDLRVPIGHLAIHQQVRAEYVCLPSWQYSTPNVDLCFIDADHNYRAVVQDSEQAWQNRNQRRWAIAWHDHNDRHPGVMRAAAEFCWNRGLTLQSRPDSDTVWATGGIG